MYAVCSLAAGSVTGIGGLASFGRVWIWVALAVWTLVLAGMLGRAGAFVLGVTRRTREQVSR